MQIHKDSNIIEFSTKRLTKDELSKLYIPQNVPGYITNHFTEIDGKYYYYKNVGYDELISELIGSYLCKAIGLDAVDYQIGCYKSLIYALSEVFYEKDYTYSTCKDFFGKSQNGLSNIPSIILPFYKKTAMIKLIDNPRMLTNLLKLTALDIRSGQVDRHINNVILKTSQIDGTTDFGKIYDFSYSFLDKEIYQDFFEPQRFYADNPLLILRRNSLTISSFCRQYPEIVTYFKTLYDISIEDVLLQIETDKNITLSKERIARFKSSDEYLKRVLQKIV